MAEADTASKAAPLVEAINKTGRSARAFAKLIQVNERTVRRWLAGDREIHGPVRQLCALLSHDPSLAAVLEAEAVK